MSKGSGRRLSAVSTEIVSNNWDKIFGKKVKDEAGGVDTSTSAIPTSGFEKGDTWLISVSPTNSTIEPKHLNPETIPGSFIENPKTYQNCINGTSLSVAKSYLDLMLILRLTKANGVQTLSLTKDYLNYTLCLLPFNDEWIDIKVTDGAFHLIGVKVLLVSFDAVYWSVHPLAGSVVKHDTWKSIAVKNGKAVFVNEQNQVVSSKNGLEWKVEVEEIKVGDMVIANRDLKNGIKKGEFGIVTETTSIDSEIYLFFKIIKTGIDYAPLIISHRVYGPSAIICWDKAHWPV